MELSKIDRLIDHCDHAIEELRLLKERLEKVIKVKEVLSSREGETKLSRATDHLKAIQQFEKIQAKLPPAIEEISKLNQELQEGLRQQQPLAAKSGEEGQLKRKI